MNDSSPVQNSLWKNQTFTRMFTSYSLSSFGDWFDLTALFILFSFVWKAEPFMLALVPITVAVPSIFLGQVAGVIADRMNKKRLMIATDFLRAGLTIALFFAPGPYWALPIMFVRATAGIFNTPAQQALLRTTVEEEDLLQANTFIGMVFQVSKIVAPFLGSFVVSLFSLQTCFIINAITFTLSGIILLTIKRIPEEEKNIAESVSKYSVIQSWLQGWRALLTTKMLLFGIIFYLFGYAGLYLVEAQLSILLREVTPNLPEIVGYVIATVGLGTFIVGGIMTRKKEIVSYGLPIAGGNLLIGMAFIGLGLFKTGDLIVWLFAFGLLIGCGTGMSMIAFSYLRQKETPVEMVGRITGITNSLISTVIIIGPISGSLLVQHFGVSTAFVVAGGFLLLLGTVGLIFRSMIWEKQSNVSKDENKEMMGGKA
ncbi:MFS transporter [Lysinibacillus sp. M3]|uniref:MFS transporter n=1 Tax=Lysinibacillus zambalensis TaxID=3160866 RepID=A0ABV1MUT3_9BACI